MAFSIIYDANVLYPAGLRDLLIRLAMKSVFQARWTDRILDEMVDGLLRNRPELERNHLERTRQLMCDSVRDCLVTDYEDLIPALELPDVNDRHVLAAAIRSHSQVIVTNNLSDFPTVVLGIWGIEAQSPDEFVIHTLELAEARVIAAIQQQADSLTNPPMSVGQVLGRLRRSGLEQSAIRIGSLLGVSPE